MSDEGLAGLFSTADEPVVTEEQLAAPGEPGRRRRFGWIARDVLLIAAAVTVTMAVLRSQGIKVSVLLVVAAFVALRLLLLAVSEVAPPPLPRRSAARGEESGEYAWATGDSLRSTVRRWEQQLEWSQEDPDRFSRIVLPALSELADERLRLRHGITRATDPRRARELMGESLWQMLNDRGRRAPKPRELAAYVDALEKI
ncbi:hypothetical protein [Actinoplanes sp. N902-109]|uniref:hypothetical protein n=1 Tax=Actinoplanes sp. (strain N902-109) TaxID=649831 RepID=UPI0003293E4D|nr:hypothetical protein [Actinoplanes sp. N902-109]AGL14609.1 hypothetical protein L083_1099 [Actinoplanes sp. N902-109]